MGGLQAKTQRWKIWQAAFKLSTGEIVRRGELLGLAGQSGVSSPHVHFGLGWKVALPATITVGVDTPKSPCGFTPAVVDLRTVCGGFPCLVTRPFAFTNYWARTQTSGGFVPVAKGTPRDGDTIRDTPP